MSPLPARERSDSRQSFKCGVISGLELVVDSKLWTFVSHLKGGPVACKVVYVFLKGKEADLGPLLTHFRISNL